MFLPQRTVDAYLTRRLKDSDLAKQAEPARIRRCWEGLDPLPPRLIHPLQHHQRVAFLLGLRNPRYLFFLSPGLGKSLVALTLFRYARLCAKCQQSHGNGPWSDFLTAGRAWIPRSPPNAPEPPRMLVLVPNSSNVGQWADEVAKHAPKLAVAGVDGHGPGERWGQMLSNSHIVVCTYMGLNALVCGGNERRKTDRGWKVQPDLLRRVSNHFSFFTFDESQAFASHRSLTYQVCKALSWAPGTSHAYALTGTPFGKDPQALWAQFHVIDRGETLGETLGIYRKAFFTEKVNFWGGWEYKFKARMKGQLARMIRHRSLRYEEGECGDLPPVVPVQRRVDFPPNMAKLYDAVLAEIRKSKGELRAIESAYLRMRYLTAGYVALRTPGGERLQTCLDPNPKLEALLADVLDLPPGRKGIVFCEYLLSQQMVCDALDKAKVGYARLWSGAKSADKRDIAKRLDDPKVQLLVSTSAGRYGGNWQAANYVFFFESPTTPDARLQEMKRAHRMGQRQRVFVFDYTVRGSVDERILEHLKEGEDLVQAILRGKDAASILARR